MTAVVMLKDQSRYSAAAAAVEDAREFLGRDQRYASIGVQVSRYQGAGLWFTGSLPTQTQCDELEQQLRQKYSSADFLIMYSVMLSAK